MKATQRKDAVRNRFRFTGCGICAAMMALVTLSGCSSTEKEAAAPDTMSKYSRPLAPGESALRPVTDHAEIRRLAGEVHDSNDALLIQALRGSSDWFRKPSSKTHFPIEGVSHERAMNTVDSMLGLLRSRPSRSEFVSVIENDYQIYQSVGWDGNGGVLYTGYCALEFDASRERTTRFQYPLYTRPDDLLTDPRTGKPLGQQLPGGRTAPYPTRREIEESNMLAGSELVWLAHPLDAYIIHVNGSAKLRMPDGSKMYIGYAGKTDREYRSLGEAMIERGILSPDQLSLKSIRDRFRNNTDGLKDLMYENECYVFFTEYSEGNWPAGSLNVRVTEKRSLATDKSIFPRGGPVIVETMIPTYSGQWTDFTRMMVDQDTGGAIQAPGRADIYMGEGKAAEILAGRQKQEGALYYIFLREDMVAQADGASPSSRR